MHKLTKKEKIELDNYWNFINVFNPYGKNRNFKKISSLNYHSVYGYREYIIKKIRKNYTIQQFYFYEKILNKLLHNLLEKINFNIDSLCINKLTNNLTDKCEKIYKITEPIKNEKELHINRRSYSYKLYITDLNKNIHYNFDYYPYLNNIEIIVYIFTIMNRRDLYEKIMEDKLNFKNITFSSSYYYYPDDYPFPNINFLFYNKNNKKYWINRIKTLYYTNYDTRISEINYDEGWYSFNYGD